MTSFKVTTPLNLGRDFFDSAETEILSTAFVKAWAFVEFDPMLGVLDASERQSRLARCLMSLLKLGETDPTPLANSGIKMLRRIGKVRFGNNGRKCHQRKPWTQAGWFHLAARKAGLRAALAPFCSNP
jgi:hypothetical protein